MPNGSHGPLAGRPGRPSPGHQPPQRHAAGSFARLGIAVEIVTISGAVEVAPKLGLADGIVDLVSTGSTLVMNGLRSVGDAVRQPGHPRGPRQPDRPTGGPRRRAAHDARGRHRRARREVPDDERAAVGAAGHRGHPAGSRVAQRLSPRPRGHGRGPRGRGGRRGPPHPRAASARPAPPASSWCPSRSCCHERGRPRHPAPRPPRRPLGRGASRPHRPRHDGHAGAPRAGAGHRRGRPRRRRRRAPRGQRTLRRRPPGAADRPRCASLPPACARPATACPATCARASRTWPPTSSASMPSRCRRRSSGSRWRRASRSGASGAASTASPPTSRAARRPIRRRCS